MSNRDDWTIWDTARGGPREMTDAEWSDVLTKAAQSSPRDATIEWSPGQHQRYLDSRENVADYDPTAEYGDPEWREPTSEREAEQRTEYLDAQRAAHPAEPAPTSREWSEVEDALDTAQEHAVLADRAHDPDPELWRRVADLEALTDLRPLPEPEPELHTHAAVLNRAAAETEQAYAARLGLDEPGRIREALDPERERNTDRDRDVDLDVDRDVDREDEEIGA